MYIYIHLSIYIVYKYIYKRIAGLKKSHVARCKSLGVLFTRLSLDVHSCTRDSSGPPTLYVEYAERRIKYGILFIFSLFYEYSNLDYGHVHGIRRVNQAEYVIRILMAAF